MRADVWNFGPPPSIGWWPADFFPFNDETIRWWNGEYWSLPTYAGENLDYVVAAAETRTYVREEIRWRRRPASWPARSRT